MSFVMNLMFMLLRSRSVMCRMTFGSSFEKNPLSCTRGTPGLWLLCVGAAGDVADFLFNVIWGVALNLVRFAFIPSF